MVAGFALAVRLAFLALTSDTYDYDEFVALLLGRDWAHGSVPYRDFMFFHPPGILVLTRALEPVFRLWWPFARVLMAIIDTATAVLVGLLGRQLWSRRAGLASGAAYALSPVALISSVRLGEDPIITFLGILGVFLILRRSPGWSVGAGACLGVAIWVKYPAAYFLPAFVLAAPRRAPLAALRAAATVAALMAPFYVDWGAIYQQSVVFQRTRWLMDTGVRVQTTMVFWFTANILAVAAVCVAAPRTLGRSRSADHTIAGVLSTAGQGEEPWAPTLTPSELSLAPPAWVTFGFVLGVLFAFNSQVYYHYFIVAVPFAALLTGWLLVRTGRRVTKILLVIGLTLAAGWGVLLEKGGSAPLYVTAAHLSDIRPTVRLLNVLQPRNGKVLADRFEYAYLANRPAIDQYFWNVGVLVGPDVLEGRLGPVSAVVLSHGASSGFPAGFVPYLDAHFHRVETGANTVWLAGGYIQEP